MKVSSFSPAALALALVLVGLDTTPTQAIRYEHPERPFEDPLTCSETSVGCPTCSAPSQTCRSRVRRSWSSLDDEEKQSYISALNILKWTSSEEGKALYGDDFVRYDELVLHHSTAENDPRGDQAHLGMHFALWHSLFILKFENALLAVDPSLQGSPYWDLREDIEYVMGTSGLHFGSTTGTGTYYEVVDGAFANWTVSSFDAYLQETAEQYGVTDILDGVFSNFTGETLLRKTNVPTTSLVRYFACADVVGPMQYNAENYEACLSTDNIADFNWCLESGATNGAHELVHFWLGSADSELYGFPCPLFSPPNLTLSGVRQGDYIDKSTSPNDPIFFLHHTFVDMILMDFMRSNPQGAATYWSFQTERAENSTQDKNPPNGTFLMDEVNSIWPFQGSELLEDPDAPQGSLKFWEVMCWLGPNTSFYTYDTFGDDICDDETASPTNAPTSSASATTFAWFWIVIPLLRFAFE